MQRELCRLVNHSLRDRRLSMVNITGMQISRDYSHARVYITHLQSEQQDKNTSEVLEILNKASGYLRSGLAGAVNTRTVPRLKFYFDPAAATGRRIEELLRNNSTSEVKKQFDLPDPVVTDE